jgi:hypothetical protein
VFERVRNFVLRVLRVPPEPQPPFGEPSSVRVFRASRRLYWLRLIGFGAAQIVAVTAILFWLTVLLATEHEAKRAQAEAAAQGRSAPVLKAGRNRPLSQGFKDVAARVPGSVFLLLWIAKSIGVLIYLCQLAITYCIVRLDYELRWYVVTDRSLRIRSGLWTVEEMTMSFANLQQVVVSQGPLQRLLSIADLRVQSAGGGAATGLEKGRGSHMHLGVFRGVENAMEIRDLILDRLRHFRETGLGDPDEAAHTPLAIPQATELDSVTAARDLVIEMRRLRETVETTVPSTVFKLN